MERKLQKNELALWKEITKEDIDRAGGLYSSVGSGVVLIT